MIHRLVTNVLSSFPMASTPSLQTFTSAISLQKTIALLYGRDTTPNLMSEGLANRLTFVPLPPVFQNLPSVSFRYSSSILMSLDSKGFLCIGTEGFSAQL